MELLGGILDRVVSVGAFGLIVLFQDEIRRFFSRIGSKRKWGTLVFIKRLFTNTNIDKEKTDFDLVQIVLACRNLAKTSTGGLIVLTRNNNIEF